MKNVTKEAKERASSSQNIAHSMPAACTYNHFKTIIKYFNTSFFRNSIIKKIFLVEIKTNNNFVHETFTNPAFRLYPVKSSDQFLSGVRWPRSQNIFPIGQSLRSGINLRKSTNIRNENLNKTLSLETGELFVFLIHAIAKTPGTHASAAIVHKKSKDEIEFFVLEPDGKIYDYHKKIAEKYFKVGPDKMYLPFDRIQGTNRICIAHSKALLFTFLQHYKQNGNRALQRFRTSKTTFSTAPVLKMGGTLGPEKSGRITSARRNSATSIEDSARGKSARPRRSLTRSVRRSLTAPIARSKVDPMPTNTKINTRNVELFWIKLQARGRKHLNNNFQFIVPAAQVINNLKRNAQYTHHFRNLNEKQLLDLLGI